MASNTASYSFLLPTVGGDTNSWGGFLNSNWEDVDDLLDGTSPVSGIDIDSGSIDGTPVGANSASTGDFTNITASGTIAATGNITEGGNAVTTASKTQTLTNKTLGDNTAVTDPASANWTGTEVINVSNGLNQDITLTGNVTTLTDELEDGESVLLGIDDGTAFAITWPTITWVSDDGSEPTLQTTGNTWISVWKNNGTLYGFASNGA